MIIESITQGCVLANRNLKLVLIRVMVSVLNIAGVFVFMIIPLVASAAYLGLDLVQAREALPVLMNNPLEFLSRYLVLAALAGISLIIYLTLSSLLIMYALGGTLGILNQSAVHGGFSFRLSDFLREAGTHFSRILWTVSFILLGALLLIIACVITWAAASVILAAVVIPGSSAEVFFNAFGTMSAVAITAVIIASGVVVTYFSLVIGVIEKTGAAEALSMTFRLLTERAQPILLCAVLFAAVIVINVMWYGFQLAFALPAFLVPLSYIAGALLQSYLAIAVWGALISYYVTRKERRAGSASYEI